MSGKTQREREQDDRDAVTDKMDEDEMRTYIKQIEMEANNPLDHLELSINAKNQITGKIKVHYDGHDSRNKHTAFKEAMEIMRNIQRVNKPHDLLSPQILTDKNMHLTDKKMDTE